MTISGFDNSSNLNGGFNSGYGLDYPYSRQAQEEAQANNQFQVEEAKKRPNIFRNGME